MRRVFQVVMVLMVASYAYDGFTGWEPAASEKEPIPPSVRSSPGGFRSYHFWHTGFQGGK